MESLNLKKLSKRVVASLSMSVIMSYLDPKQIISLQHLSNYTYHVAIPRSIYLCQTIYRQVCAVDQLGKHLIIYNSQTDILQTLNFKSANAEAHIPGQYSIKATQTPNGKIYLVNSIVAPIRKMKILYLNQKEMKLNLIFESTNHCNFKGAVCSSMDKIFVGGSSVGKTKACVEFNLRAIHNQNYDQNIEKMQIDSGSQSTESRIVKDLPNLQFSHTGHSMICHNQKYLYVFGGSFMQRNIYYKPIFERLDLHGGIRNYWEIIHFQWGSLDLIRMDNINQSFNIGGVAMTSYSQNEILIFTKELNRLEPISMMFEEDKQTCRRLTFARLSSQQDMQTAQQIDFCGDNEPIVQEGHLKDHREIYCFDRNLQHLVKIQVRGAQVKTSLVRVPALVQQPVQDEEMEDDY
eukprot:403372397